MKQFYILTFLPVRLASRFVSTLNFQFSFSFSSYFTVFVFFFCFTSLFTFLFYLLIFSFTNSVLEKRKNTKFLILIFFRNFTKFLIKIEENDVNADNIKKLLNKIVVCSYASNKLKNYPTIKTIVKTLVYANTIELIFDTTSM